MRIQHNIAALNSYRNLSGNNNSVSKNLEKLSSGYRINRAGDDAAGLAISEKMRAQITGLDTAQKNAQDGISLVQTAEGNLQEVHDMLNRMTELATQSANGTYDDATDRANLQKEFDALSTEINRISKSANFNGIKLLDGSLAANEAATITDGVVSTTAGVTLTQGQNGAGTKGTYEIDLGGGLFGTGDTLTITGFDLTGAAITENFAFINEGVAEAANGNIKGATAEEQAASLAEAMKKRANINGNFDISVDGKKVILTSKEEGAGKSRISTATATDVTASLGAFTNATPAVGANALTGAGWTGMFGTGAAGSSTGYNVEVGDVIRFGFKDGAGNDLFADVTITQDMIDLNPALDDLTTAITNKLSATNFKDIDGTAADESKMKVSDMFTITANEDGTSTTANGSLHVEGVAGTAGGIGSAQILRDGVAVATNAATTGTAATGGTAASWELAAPAAGNFSKGDVVTISGTLSDGNVFTANLEAGKDFGIGGTYAASAENIKNALNNGNVKIIIGAGDTAREVTSDQLFGANKDFAAVANAGGELTITSNISTTAGKGKAGAINTISLTPVSNAVTDLEKTEGIAQGYATSSIDVDEKIQYGTAVTIGDYTFEVVADARDVTSRNNNAVVISDLENKSAAEIAKAIADAAVATGKFASKTGPTAADGLTMDGSETAAWSDAKMAAAKNRGAEYGISAVDGKISITTLDKGSAIAAPKLSTPYGDNIGTKSIKFDGAKLDYGDSLEINGKTYEFVKKPTDAKEGNIGIVVDDIHTATSKQIGDALADVARDVKATVAEDGTVTIQSNADADGKVKTPTIVFEGEGLRLQVGETNDDFQKVNVKIRAVNTETLGLDDINIANQDDAGRAIEVIKKAINSVSGTRGDLGALQNRLDHTINNLGVTSENMTAAESRIRDVDMAKEMMDYTKNNILVQAAQAMLAQANQVPQGVLQLLQ